MTATLEAARRIFTGSTLQLRPYQQEAIRQVRERFGQGRRSVLLVAPTGAGKTIVGSEIARLAVSRGGSVVWLAHRLELIKQAADKLRALGMEVGEVWPGAAPVSSAPVQVCSVQTLRARGKTPPGSMLIPDEAHHYASDDWSRILEAYPEGHRVGLTATPIRADGKGLGGAFDCLVEVSTVRELTDLGHLVPCRVVAPAKPLGPGLLAQAPVDAWRQHCQGRRTVVFAPTVAQALEIVDSFKLAGQRAVVVHGKMSQIDRGLALCAHRSEGAVLVNVYVLTEGWDSPQTSAVILARGCGSVGTYLQIVGRVLRPAKGKQDALLVDLRGQAFYQHGPPDAPRDWHLTHGIGSKRGAHAFCKVCGALLDDGQYPCVECEFMPENYAPPKPRITGDELAERYAAKREENREERIATLALWMLNGRKKGYKPGYAMGRYNAVYGEWPSNGIKHEAAERSRNLRMTLCTMCGSRVALPPGVVEAGPGWRCASCR